jgi:hypothetical protein
MSKGRRKGLEGTHSRNMAVNRRLRYDGIFKMAQRLRGLLLSSSICFLICRYSSLAKMSSVSCAVWCNFRRFSKAFEW